MRWSWLSLQRLKAAIPVAAAPDSGGSDAPCWLSPLFSPILQKRNSEKNNKKQQQQQKPALGGKTGEEVRRARSFSSYREGGRRECWNQERGFPMLPGVFRCCSWRVPLQSLFYPFMQEVKLPWCAVSACLSLSSHKEIQPTNLSGL